VRAPQVSMVFNASTARDTRSSMFDAVIS
jgi:hypothetical protein